MPRVTSRKLVRLEDPRTREVRTVPVVHDGVARERPEPPDRRKPDWLRVGLTTAPVYRDLRGMLKELRLHTVCEEAHCPNIGECWGKGTMTIMILGGVCTRACPFCAVDTGNPRGWTDPDEPAHVAEAVRRLRLGYVVLTSVDRDDLADGGAAHFAAVVRAMKEARPEVRAEALTPDFRGDLEAVQTVLGSGLDVFAHNLETVRRRTPEVRDPRATYDQSLAVLYHARAHADRTRPDVLVKSSLMLGLGETDDEIRETMDDLRAAGVDILTLGQYLRPTRSHLPVERYVTPEQFDRYRDWGAAAGFREVFSGPLVRSSYRAEQVFAGAGD
jgi:lipoic acid synthetase